MLNGYLREKPGTTTAPSWAPPTGTGHGGRWLRDTRSNAGLAFLADGKTLVFQEGFDRVFVWDLEQAKERLAWRPPGPEYLKRLAVAAQARIVAGAIGNEVVLWDAATGRVLHTLADHDEKVHSLGLATLFDKLTLTLPDKISVDLRHFRECHSFRQSATASSGRLSPMGFIEQFEHYSLWHCRGSRL